MRLTMFLLPRSPRWDSLWRPSDSSESTPQALKSVWVRGGVAGFDSLGMSDNISAIWLKIMEVGLV